MTRNDLIRPTCRRVGLARRVDFSPLSAVSPPDRECPGRVIAMDNDPSHLPEPFPTAGRLAGIDFGTVRIGVSVCDPRRTIASPFATYARRNQAADADYFRGLAVEEQIVGFVVGLPVYGSGAESQKSLEAREFGRWLTGVTGQPVCFFDERYTTVEAQHALAVGKLRGRQRKKRLDMLAAQILLAAFLESSDAARQSPQPLDDAGRASKSGPGPPDEGVHRNPAGGEPKRGPWRRQFV